jgi:pyruvate/2-oxoglutarate dehydrogenase complex dihydrolipoamide dehydrogenase (E3) component
MSAEAEEIVYGLGRAPNLERLGLNEAGVKTQMGRMATTSKQQTNVEHIFAAGDAAGPHEIVHIAIQQAEVVARNAKRLVEGKGEEMEETDYRLKLFVAFTEPQVAAIGFNERELMTAGAEYEVARYAFSDHGKAEVLGETDGFVKLIVRRGTCEILGAAAVGPEAGELIHEIAVAMYFRATAHDLAKVPHYHPTLSEIWTYPAEELAMGEEAGE